MLHSNSSRADGKDRNKDRTAGDDTAGTCKASWGAFTGSTIAHRTVVSLPDSYAQEQTINERIETRRTLVNPIAADFSRKH